MLVVRADNMPVPVVMTMRVMMPVQMMRVDPATQRQVKVGCGIVLLTFRRRHPPVRMRYHCQMTGEQPQRDKHGYEATKHGNLGNLEDYQVYGMGVSCNLQPLLAATRSIYGSCHCLLVSSHLIQPL